MKAEMQSMGMSWKKFAGMIITSVIVMFFLMYQLIYTLDHALFSMNRLISSVVMGCVMAIIMLLFMWPMYHNKRTKMIVLIVAFVGGAVLLVMNRNQTLINDVSFTKSMIPHHSIAINNARKAKVSDPRVRKLADQIIESQVREIAEMKMLLQSIKQNGEQGDTHLLPARSADLTPEMEQKAQEDIR